MTSGLSQWKAILRNRKKLLLLTGGFSCFFLAFYTNNIVSTYTDSVSGPTVHDLILDHLPMLDLNFVFFWLVLIYWVSMFIYHLARPKEMAFVLYSISLLIFVRCFFISLTHLGPPETKLVIPEELSYYSFNADLFFSGHVGAPFFFALITGNKFLRWLSVFYSILMIFIVLLSHGHYSIDIFGALFIAHSLSVLVNKVKPIFFSLN